MDSMEATAGQLEEVLAILRAVLAADNEERKRNEHTLQTLRADHPNELVLCLLAATRRVPEVEIRALAAVLLRQMMTALSSSSAALWHRLRREVRSTVKTELLAAVAAESERSVRRRLGDVVGELGATVFVAQEEAWSELLPFLFRLAEAADPGQVAASMHIFAALFSFVHDQALQHKASLYTTFSQALSSSSIEVQAGAVEALSSFLSTVDNREIQEFNALLQPLLVAVLHLIQQNAGEAKEAVECLITIAETEPKFYCEEFDVLLEFLQRVFHLQTDSGVKSLVLETVVHVVGRKPKLLRSDTQRCVKVLDAVFALMLSVELAVEEGWLRPPEGFQDREVEEEDAEDIDYAKTGRRVVTRLLETVGEVCLLPLVLSAVRSLLSDGSDWRKKYTALLTLSQLGPFIADPEKVADLIPLLQAHSLPTLHPKIKYAAYHCIAQFCEDLEDDFKDPHHCSLAVLLHAGLADPTPRVVAQALHAVAGFFTSCSHVVAAAHAGAMLERLRALLGRGTPSVVLEGALTALATVADANKEQFSLQADTLTPLLLQLVQAYAAPAYTQFRGKAIECLTLMCSAVGRDSFRSYAQPVVELLRQIQDTQLTSDDPQITYLLTAWQRLCITLKEEFAVYLPQVVPGLLGLATPQTSSQESAPSVDFESLLQAGPKRLTVTNSDLEDKVVALETVLTIVDTMKGSYLPYVQSTTDLVLPLVHYSLNEDVRGMAAGILGALVAVVRLSALPDAQAKSAVLARAFMQSLHPALMEEFDTDTLVHQLHALKICVEAPSCAHLSAAEVASLGQELVKLLLRSLQKRTNPSAESDEESTDQLPRLEEDRVHTSISEVFGALFRTHTEAAVPVVVYLYDNVLRVFLDPTACDEDHKFSLYIIDDIVEYVGPARVAEQWGYLLEALLRYATAGSEAVRQAACYGLGQFAQRTAPALFCDWSATVLQALSAAISLPRGKSARAFGQARDHAVAAVGRVLRYQSQCIDVERWMEYWVRELPLKHDKSEARVAHELLVELATSQVTGRAELLPQIVRIFGEVLETKLLSAHTLPQVKAFFQQLRQAPPGVWSGLTDLHKRRIAALIEH